MFKNIGGVLGKVLTLLFFISYTVNAQKTTDSIKNKGIEKESYDNFKNTANPANPHVIIKSPKTGVVLFEEKLKDGKCIDCYNSITTNADKHFKNKNFADAATLYEAAFMLNENKGMVKHRFNAACSYTALNNFDKAFDNLNRIVFGAGFYNQHVFLSYDCLKPLQKDKRWAAVMEGLNKNMQAVQQNLMRDTEIKNQ